MKMKDTFGDQSKRICEYYACCPNLKEIYEDETGCQLFCKVCGASLWAEIEEGE